MPITGSQEEISLYFHIPFCTKKCPYCHFFVLPDQPQYKLPFHKALLQEIELRKPQLEEKKIVSIYWGGGTPTKLSLEMYEKLFAALSPLNLAKDCEITLEANPEDVTFEKMLAFKQLGVNRVSLGLQSLVDSELCNLQRTHTASRSEQAVYETFRAGIENISVDLLFDLPSQTLQTLGRSLSKLEPLPISHLSLYNLVLEPNTVFFKDKAKIKPLLPTEEESLAMLEIAESHFSKKGLQRYEISAFAIPGKESKHNTGYWRGRSFLGLGPSAFSYWEGARFSNTTKFQRYLDQLNQKILPVDFQEKLPYPENLKELLAIELRMLSGVSKNGWKKRYGEFPTCINQSLSSLKEQGLLEITEDSICLTKKGTLFYDDVASCLI